MNIPAPHVKADFLIRPMRRQRRRPLIQALISANVWMLASGGFPADPGPAINSGLNPILSADGRRLVYPRQTAGVLQLHLLDAESGVTKLISHSTTSQDGADGASFGAQFIDQGQTIVFESDANGLVAADTNHLSDVFLGDLNSGTLRCLSLRADGHMGDGPAGRPLASADGRFIAWESESRGQVVQPTDPFGLPDIFLHDRTSGTTVMLNTNRLGKVPAGVSTLADLSRDGRRTLFRCTTNDLTAPVLAGTTSTWYWRDNVTGTNRMIRLNPGGSIQSVPLTCFGFSGNGRYVGAAILGTGPTTNAVFRLDLDTGTYIQGPRIGPVITPVGATGIRFEVVHRMDFNRDGSRALISGIYRVINVPTPARRGIALWEPDTQQSRAIELASAPGAIPTGFLHSAELSPDESKLAVVNSELGLLVIDLQGNVLFGPVATGEFPAPAFSSDGRWLVFQIGRGNPSTTPLPVDSLFLVDLSIVTRPKLTISRSNPGLVLGWDPALADFRLEASDGVSGWQPVDPSESGRRSLLPTAPVQFFRLRKL